MKIKHFFSLYLIFISFIYHPVLCFSSLNTGGNELIKIVTSNRHRLILQIEIPPFVIEKTIFQGKEYNIINVNGFAQTSDPGTPQLPTTGFLFAVPEHANITVAILEADYTTHSMENIFYSPQSFLRKQIKGSDEGVPRITYQLESKSVDSAFIIDNYYPQQIVQLDHPAILRDQIIGRLKIFPIQYNAQTKMLRYHHSIRVKITFREVDVTQQSETIFQLPQPFEKILSTSLLNYEVARSWRLKNRERTPNLWKPSAQFNINEGEWYKIFTEEMGIYRLDHDDLVNTGIDPGTIDPRNIQIYHRGIEIPIFILGQEDGHFDENDYIEFFANSIHSEFTRFNVYWMTFSDNPGRRMLQQNGSLTGVYPIVTRSLFNSHFEQNNEYHLNMPDSEGEDYWFWQNIVAPNSFAINVDLSNVSAIPSLPCRLKIEYRGESHLPENPDHHSIVSLNNNKLLDDLWDGEIKFQSEANFPQSYLQEGDNRLTIELPGDIVSLDRIFFNWVEIQYWRDNAAVADEFMWHGTADPGSYQFEIRNFSNKNIMLYDITDSTDVRNIVHFEIDSADGNYNLKFQNDFSNRWYYALTSDRVKKPKALLRDVPSQLRSINNQADYLIISHPSFLDNLALLANLRQNQGLHVMTIDVKDIYDEFNNGIKNPRAIKDFLSYAYHNWRQPSPTYVLLVGDASFDYKNYLNTNYNDFLPTHLFESHTYHFKTASDNWYVCVNGDDILPDMFIGRLPVRTATELDIMINKIIGYEVNPVIGPWKNNLLFVADNNDAGGDFEQISDTFIDRHVPSGYYVTKIYVRDYGNPAEIRDAIVHKINNGCLVTNYIGHGSVGSWAHESIFQSDQISRLINGNKLPIVVTLSCINGYFHDPERPYCLAEEFLKFGQGGSIACLSPSGFGYTAADQYLGNGFYKALFQDKDNILGSAVAKAKLAVFSLGNTFRDHIEFFNLFGDPALRIDLPARNISVDKEWNLISLPRKPDNSSVEHILSSLDGKWSKLMAYENGSWIGADANIPSTYWTLTQMEWGRGYWLLTTGKGEIAFRGTEKSSSILLNQGWNLIGNPTSLPLNLSDALSSIHGNWSKMLYYSNGTWFGADASLPSSFWTLHELKSGAGYWLEMTAGDTLNISRIPVLPDEPLLTNSGTGSSPLKYFPSAKSSGKEKAPVLSTVSSGESYKLSVPMPSGYYGSVSLKNKPVSPGSKISVWINGIQFPPVMEVTTPGQYNLMLINGDDLTTPAIEGGRNGDVVSFKITTPSGETFFSEIRGIWEEGINHRLNLSALSVSHSDSTNLPIQIELFVDDRIVGKEILDGDPISNTSIISATISSNSVVITKESVHLLLNSTPISTMDFSYIPDNENPDEGGKLIYQPVQLDDGYYELKIEVTDITNGALKATSDFSFRLSSALKIEKIVNFPNPMQQDTKFTYYILNETSPQVTIKIYTVAGRLIRSIEFASNQVGYNETYWDGTDEFGDEIANGVYFYRIVAKDGAEKTEVIEKLIMMK